MIKTDAGAWVHVTAAQIQFGDQFRRGGPHGYPGDFVTVTNVRECEGWLSVILDTTGGSFGYEPSHGFVVFRAADKLDSHAS
jgi:hypothetical protein